MPLFFLYRVISVYIGPLCACMVLSILVSSLSIAHYIASNGRMIDELERIYDETTVV